MGKECNQVTAASIGRKDQEPDTVHNGDDMLSTEATTNPNPDRGTVTQQVRPAHAYRTSTCPRGVPPQVPHRPLDSAQRIRPVCAILQ